MDKKILITLIFLLIIVAGTSTYFLLKKEKIDVLMMTHDDLYEHALKQTDVQNHLGNQKIEDWGGSPASATFSDDEYQGILSPGAYKVIAENKPSCLNNIQVGDLIRIITFHTSSKSVWVFYSLETNDIPCVLSYPIDKYAED